MADCKANVSFSRSVCLRSVLAGAVTSVCSVLVFLLDSSVPQETFTAGRELALYAVGLCAALVFARMASRGGDSSLNKTSTEESLFQTVRSRVSSMALQVGKYMRELKRDLVPPSRRQGHDAPVMPAWAIFGVIGAFVTLGTLLVTAAFVAGSADSDPFTLLDASPRACGPDGKPIKARAFSLHSMGWVAAAIWMSAGLCVTHPLTSGLIMGF
eukprot:TRINITY_DN81393_c0_g1_i1.p2 TRINITY_DN81393_c0_g1~~TRINITY_DN81393_c0_g1_i1.p2  ORF type:complete len:213 (-),score=17.63 TRINITY_DN81393_c0_g1_i1:63-701(-)